jgi:hypothetical protein
VGKVFVQDFGGGDNCTKLFLGEMNTGTWPSNLGSLKIWSVKYGHEPNGNQVQKRLR